MSSSVVPDSEMPPVGKVEANSNSAAAPQTSGSTTCPCAHCGLPSPRPSDPSLPAFCCLGCKGAYELIQGWGLNDFYDLQQPDHQFAVDGGQNDFTDLDDPQLLGHSAPRLVSGGQRPLMKTELAVTGLHCAACAWLIERVPTQLTGWVSAKTDMHRRTIDIVFDPAQIKLSQIARTLSRIGYDVAPLVKDRVREAETIENRRILIDLAIAAFCAANAMWIAVALYAGQFSGIAANHLGFLRFAGVCLGLVAVLVPGRVFFRSALASLKTWTPHMDLPVALGLTAGSLASVYGLLDVESEVYFDSMACLVFFLLLGRWIQIRQQRRAGEAVAELTRLTPVAANRLSADESIERVPADQVNIGDLVVVYPGESLPVDGEVTRGSSLLDRSLLTGESRPVPVSPGSQVEAGADNLQSALTIQTTRVGNETRIGCLARSVADAASSRTPVIQLANRVGGWFVVVVIGLAWLTAVLWWRTPSAALANSVSLLIVACPCALALATPLAIALTVGRLARRRVLVRSGECLERLTTPGTIFFDKTGTLTEGKTRVTHYFGDETALAAAAAIEADVNHPVARAIVLYAEAQGIVPSSPNSCPSRCGRAENVEQTVGRGITGVVDDRKYCVGNASWLRDVDQQVDGEFSSAVREIRAAGASPIFVLAEDQRLCRRPIGVFGIADPVRPSGQGIVSELKRHRWHVAILSGDNQQTAESVASQLGISDVRGQLLPDDKLAAIAAARGDGPVVMVGDGVNDAAALAAADVGVAVRGGAAASLAAAPVMIAGQQLDGVLDLLRGSDMARRTIHRNFAVSLTYNVLAVVLAIVGYITPLLAAILMPISSISVLAMTLSSRLPQAEVPQ